MKNLLIFCLFSSLLFFFNKESLAQCSKTSERSISCYVYNGDAFQQSYTVPSGIPIHVSTFIIINSEHGFFGGAEADLGSRMWFTSASGVGGHGDATTFTSAENVDGHLYLAMGAPSDGSGHIAVYW